MQMAQEKVHPMTVVTIANARVHDLIGLICWQYTSEGREPKLKWVQTSFNTSFTECQFPCNKLFSLLTCLSHLTTVRMWTPTASTLLRMMARLTQTFPHWTPMSQSISLVSALWRWWRNTLHLALLPDSRCLSECKQAHIHQCVNIVYIIIFPGM